MVKEGNGTEVQTRICQGQAKKKKTNNNVICMCIVLINVVTTG